MRTARVSAALLMLVVLSACGRKADPLPPIIEVPETTTDLTVRQEGHDVVLSWSYPKLTRAGRELTDLALVEVWRLQVPPGQEQVDNENVKRQLMLARGKLVAKIEGSGLAAATQGGRLVYREPLPEIPQGTTPPTVWFAVRSRRADGTTSALSNIVGGRPQPIPPPVTGLEATTAKDGITLTWNIHEGETYLVERRPSPAALWGVVSRAPLPQATFHDGDAVQGQSWWYRVRVVNSGVWGPATEPLKVDYPDVYPPDPVTTLVCLPEPGRVSLRWETPAGGVVRYKVFRRIVGDEGWEHLTENLAGTEFIDTAPPPGEVEYAVRAVDAAGNEAEPAICTVRNSS